MWFNILLWYAEVVFENKIYPLPPPESAFVSIIFK